MKPTPHLKGGQGRSSESIERDCTALVFTAVLVAVFFILFLARQQ